MIAFCEWNICLDSKLDKDKMAAANVVLKRLQNGAQNDLFNG